MKEVVTEDRHGRLRRVLVRDDDGDEMAKYGLPVGPPDIEEIDWEIIKIQINNILVKNRVVTRQDLQQTGSLAAIAGIVKRHVDALFRQEDAERKEMRSGQVDD